MGDTQHNSQLLQPGMQSAPVLAWDMMGQPGKMEGNLVPTCLLAVGDSVPHSKRHCREQYCPGCRQLHPSYPTNPSAGRLCV